MLKNRISWRIGFWKLMEKTVSIVQVKYFNFEFIKFFNSKINDKYTVYGNNKLRVAARNSFCLLILLQIMTNE